MNKFACVPMVALLAFGVAPVPSPAQEDDAVVEEIVVLGSRIPARSNTETPVAVDILNSEELDNTGARETGRALQAAAPSFNFSSSTISDGTDALRPATLRGLGPDQTLVLINGKRRHQSALIHVNSSVGRGTAGVDMNAIPIGAIERIEVLRDGASALYGSDAMAGVINLKLKANGDGRVHFDYGQYGEGDGTTPHIWWHDGFDIGNGGIVTATLSYRDREATNRAGVDGTRQYPLLCGNGTTLFNDADDSSDMCGAGGHTLLRLDRYTATGDDRAAFTRDEYTANRSGYRIGDADSEQIAAVVNLELPLNDTWDLLAFATFSTRDNQSGGFRRRPTDINRAFNGLDPTGAALLPPGTAYADGFLPLINTEIADTSFSVSARGEVTDDISVDVSLTNGANELDYLISNSINASYFGTSAVRTALTRGTQYQYVHPVSGQRISKSISGPSRGPFQADSGGLRYDQTSINADFLYLYREELSFAFGFEQRSENFAIRSGEDYSWYNYGGHNPSYNTGTLAEPTYQAYAGGIQVFPGFRPESAVDEGRDNIALYAEANYTDADIYIASAALRFEDYSDFGNVLTYKLAGRYEVSPDILAVRGAFSTGFRAPSLHQIYFNNVSTIFVDGNPTQTGTFRNDSIVARGLGIPALTEETSTNLSLGLTYSPESLPLTLTLDYYTISISDRVFLSGALAVNNNDGTPNEDLPAAVRNALIASEAGRAQVFYNAGDTSTTGFDLILNYEINPQVDLSVSYNSNDTTVDSIAIPGNLVGVSVDTLFSRRDRDIVENWQPQTRLNIAVDWTLPRFKLYGAARQIGEYNISSDTENQTVSPSLLFDVRATYDLNSEIRFIAGADNLLDEVPDEVNPSLGSLASREGSVTEPDGTVAASSSLGIFPFPRGSAPFGFNGSYFYFGVDYRY